jgi:hypothetical protein
VIRFPFPTNSPPTNCRNLSICLTESALLTLPLNQNGKNSMHNKVSTTRLSSNLRLSHRQLLAILLARLLHTSRGRLSKNHQSVKVRGKRKNPLHQESHRQKQVEVEGLLEDESFGEPELSSRYEGPKATNSGWKKTRFKP